MLLKDRVGLKDASVRRVLQLRQIANSQIKIAHVPETLLPEQVVNLLKQGLSFIKHLKADFDDQQPGP
jgi:hypothetical protein